MFTQLSQVSLTLYLLGVKKELSGVNSATLHGVKRTFDCLRMRFKRKSFVLSEVVTPFYFTKLTPVYYLRNFSIMFIFASSNRDAILRIRLTVKVTDFGSSLFLYNSLRLLLS